MKHLFVATQAQGTVWYRMANFAKYMGVEIFPDKWLEGWQAWEFHLHEQKKIYQDLALHMIGKDSCVMQRLQTPMGVAVMQAIREKYSKPVYTEIDDNVKAVDSTNPGYVALAPGSGGVYWFEKQMEKCDGIIVSTEELKKVYKPYNKVEVIPNAIDFDIWDNLKKPKKNKKLRIGWEGGPMHTENLSLLKEIVPTILAKHDVEFHFFGLCPDFLRGDGVIFHPPVHFKKYIETINSLNFDIVLAPMVDSEFNRCKSNIRVLEAGALKRAVIASANKYLPYARTIDDGDDGLLAKNNEWAYCIERLILDHDLREGLGSELYKKVKKEYNIKDSVKKYNEFLGVKK